MKVVAIKRGQCNGRLWEPQKGGKELEPFEIPDEPVHKSDNKKRKYKKGMPLAFSPNWMKVYESPKKEEESEENLE